MRKVLYALAALVVVVPASAIFAARATLPQSECEVSEAQIAAVQLETRLEQVRAALGCDGVRAVEFEIEGLTSETYSWRGTAWPYSTFTGHFYNGVLHGKDARTVSFSLSWAEPEGEAVAAADE